MTVCQVLRRNFWRHFSYQEGADRVSCVNEFLLAGMQWTRQCCFLEAPRHETGRSRYISHRWVQFQFPLKFQTVQECTGAYIPGKPVVSALARLRKQGNAKWNVTITAEDGQRKCEGSKVICSICGGVYKKIFFYRHVKVCKTPKNTTVIEQASVTTNRTPTEWEKVLKSMDKDKIFFL